MSLIKSISGIRGTIGGRFLHMLRYNVLHGPFIFYNQNICHKDLPSSLCFEPAALCVNLGFCEKSEKYMIESEMACFFRCQQVK